MKECAEGAAFIIEYGSCAAWGGIQAAKPNPTNTVSVSSIVKGKKIIKVPGCPPIPEVMTGVIMHYALFGEIPPLDVEGRPKQFYGNRIHDTCYRRPFFDSGLFVEHFDDDASKAGWCLYKVGCRGPETYNSCGMVCPIHFNLDMVVLVVLKKGSGTMTISINDCLIFIHQIRLPMWIH